MFNHNKQFRNTHKHICRHSPFQCFPPNAPSTYSSFWLLTRRLSLALLPFVLPAVERSISPRKCISLRELQTTRRMPTVCSPSTSHLSWKNRCILSPFLSLCFCLQKSFPCPGTATSPPPNPPTAPRRDARLRLFSLSSQSPSICRYLAILTPHGSPSAFFTEGRLLFSSFPHRQR